jgi:Icc-related predicted phosphoesterase
MRALTAWFGDVHGNLGLMWQTAQGWERNEGYALDWVFQVGDFGTFKEESRLDPSSRKHAEKHGYSLQAAVGDFPRVLSGELKVPIPTYFIRGNHEDQEYLLDLHRQRKDYHLRHPVEVVKNLFYVPDGCVFELDGLRIAGWGGCWGKNTWEMGYWSPQRAASNKEGYTRRLNHMTRDVFERLRRERFEVLVTHDAPTGCGLKGMHNPHSSLLDPESITENNEDGPGMPHIRELIEEVQPLNHFCGHWHEYQQVRFGKTRSTVLDKVHPGEDRRCMEIVEL